MKNLLLEPETVCSLIYGAQEPDPDEWDIDFAAWCAEQELLEQLEKKLHTSS